MTTWTASYDRTTKIVTSLVCALLAVICLTTRSPIVFVPAALIVALAFASSPRGYSLSGQTLVVKRLIGKVKIPLDTLREARAATSDDLQGCLRLWGSGGLFGYYGLFQTAVLGTCSWYVTDKSKLVLLVTGAKTLLVSPDDRDDFLASLHPVASGETAIPPRAPSRFGMRPVVFVSGAVFLLVFALLLAWSPGLPKLALSPQSLEIKDRFYPVTIQAADVDSAKIRVVNVTGNSEWRPTHKNHGFSNLQYRSGWYRVAGGSTVRLYGAGGNRLVLLPPRGNGTPVLVDVKDPDLFAERLRGLWASAR
jgi:hypothetical protein